MNSDVCVHTCKVENLELLGRGEQLRNGRDVGQKQRLPEDSTGLDAMHDDEEGNDVRESNGKIAHDPRDFVVVKCEY